MRKRILRTIQAHIDDIYMYVCVYMYLCVYVCIRTLSFVCVYICMYIHIFAFICGYSWKNLEKRMLR